MQGPDYCKQDQRAGSQIASENKEVGQYAHYQDLLSVESVCDVTREGPCGKSQEDVAAQHEADGVFCGMESLAQIQREKGGDQVKGEEEAEVDCHHLGVVPVPEFLLCFHIGCKFIK